MVKNKKSYRVHPLLTGTVLYFEWHCNGSAEVKVFKERCHDPNVLYNAKDYTLHTYKDSVRMDKPLFVCINKVKHKEPVFFSTVDEMKAHWPCLDLTLVAQPTGSQAAIGRGKRTSRQAKVNGSKTSAQVEAGNSSRVDTTKAGPSTQVDIFDIQMQDVEKIIS